MYRYMPERVSTVFLYHAHHCFLFKAGSLVEPGPCISQWGWQPAWPRDPFICPLSAGITSMHRTASRIFCPTWVLGSKLWFLWLHRRSSWPLSPFIFLSLHFDKQNSLILMTVTSISLLSFVLSMLYLKSHILLKIIKFMFSSSFF